MIVLLLAVVALSLADLIVTLIHLKTVGLVEANPLARWIINTTGSTWALAAFKGATVATCVALLYRLRHHIEGEIASWCAVGILVGMCFLWHGYTHTMLDPNEVILAQGEPWEEYWLQLD